MILKKINKKFVLLSAYFNAEDFILDNFKSIMSQDFESLGVIYLDDGSSDRTTEKIISQGRNWIKDRTGALYNIINGVSILVIRREENCGSAAYQQWKAVKERVVDENSICGVLDGDDFLTFNHSIKSMFNYMNKADVWVAKSGYKRIGESRLNIPCMQMPHAKLPFQTPRHDPNTQIHMRCFKKGVSDQVPLSYLQNSKGELYRASSDYAYLFTMMEIAGARRCGSLNSPIYSYRLHERNDYVLHGPDTRKNTTEIRNTIPIRMVNWAKKLTSWQM